MSKFELNLPFSFCTDDLWIEFDLVEVLLLCKCPRPALAGFTHEIWLAVENTMQPFNFAMLLLFVLVRRHELAWLDHIWAKLDNTECSCCAQLGVSLHSHIEMKLNQNKLASDVSTFFNGTKSFIHYQQLECRQSSSSHVELISQFFYHIFHVFGVVGFVCGSRNLTHE